MSSSVRGLLASCLVFVVTTCSSPQRGGEVGDQTDTCSNKSSSFPSESETSIEFCTASVGCPLAPEDQGDIVARFCTMDLQKTCAPCHCPEPGIMATSKTPRCNATVGDNPKTTKYVTSCEVEWGNAQNPVKGCTPELPSKCICAIKVPKDQTLKCRCSCPGVL
jgi:hypothetical protein